MIIKARMALEEANKELAQQAASVLAAAGFDITHIGSRGISFEGNAQSFQKFFRSKLGQKNEGFAFESKPDLPDALADTKANVYFPTQPDFFS